MSRVQRERERESDQGKEREQEHGKKVQKKGVPFNEIDEKRTWYRSSRLRFFFSILFSLFVN